MNYDAVVIGGGLVGGITSLALNRAGLRVASVEAREPGSVPPRDHYAQRVSAISPASQNILQALGVWRRLVPQRLCAYTDMRVWDQGGRGQVHFDAGDAGLAILGTIVENRELEWALAQSLKELPIAQYRPARLDGFSDGGEFLELNLDQARLRTRLLIGADGAHSRVRELAGIQASQENYGQKAVVAVVRCREPHRHTAYQRFLDSGPLAFLPLSGNYNSIVWSTSTEHAESLQALSDERFCAQLGDAFEMRLGPVETAGPRAAFPLWRILAQRYLAPRVALVGDAAHTIHPLAGQGVNLGLLDAAALAQVVENVQAADRDIGLPANLRAYERWRRGHNTLVAQAMSGFVKLFGSHTAAARRARNLGFDITDRLVPLKRLFMLYASGQAGRMPRLAMTDS